MEDKRIELLGRKIRHLRKQRGFSQEGLANQSKIDRSYMGAIERGERNITLLKFFHICDVLEIEPAEVLRDLNMRE